MVLSLVKPQYFVPVHGEYRHLTAHAQLAWDLGLGESGIFVLEDGDVLQIADEGAKVVGTIPVGPLYLDGVSARDTHSEVLSQRRALSKDGVVVIVVNTDNRTGLLSSEPKAVASGFMDAAETEGLFQKLSDTLAGELQNHGQSPCQPDELKSKVRETARKFLANETRRRPIIIPILISE